MIVYVKTLNLFDFVRFGVCWIREGGDVGGESFFHEFLNRVKREGVFEDFA